MVSIKGFFLIALSGILIANGSGNLAVTSDELINKAKEYDKKEVVYTGEMIGDIMQRGQYAWINISDGNNAVGIWLPYDQTKQIKYKGSYDFIGDTIKVTGTFNRACAEHGGDFDIHAKKIEVVKEGHRVIRTVNYQNFYIAAGLFILALFLAIIIFRKKY
jgi:aspartyl/asparaginyl-tRNA synthetase